MKGLDLRIEEASLNAWPALTQMLYDGWIIRMTHGFTRRANSVTPLADGGFRSVEEKIRWCENYYARAGQPTLFRLPSCAPVADLGEILRSRGYVAEEPTCVLSAAIAPEDAIPTSVHFTDRQPWLRVYGALTGEPETAQKLHDVVLRGIPGDCMFAVVQEDGSPVACGLGVVEDDLVGLFDIVTSQSARRRGHGRNLVNALHQRAAAAGARCAYLQMHVENAAAAQLYDHFGYRERYRYEYLRGA